MPQRGSLDVKLASWKLGSYIPLLGSASNKGPDFIIRGSRSAAGQGGSPNFIRQPERALTATSHIDLIYSSIPLGNMGEDGWGHIVTQPERYIMIRGKAFPSYCFLEGTEHWTVLPLK